MNKWMPLFALSCLLPCSVQAQFPASAPTSYSEVAPVSDDATLQSLLHATSPRHALNADDTVRIQVYGVPEYNIEKRIDTSGNIDLPLIGVIPAAGLTVLELQQEVARDLLKAKMVDDPQVTVTAVAQPSSFVVVAGEVTKPGTFPALGNQTISSYLSQAGGIVNQLVTNATGNAPGSAVVTLIRPSLPAPVQIPLGPEPKYADYGHIPVFAGDEIRVGKVGFIYAVGAFKNQNVFSLKNSSPTTAVQLIALAGGVGYEADGGDAHIVRTQGTSTIAIPVNINRLLKGTDPDVVLHPDDILFVPSNKLRAAIKGGGTSLIISLASSLIYTR